MKTGKLKNNNSDLKDYFIKKFSKYLNLKDSEIIEIGIGKGRFGLLLAKEFKHYYGIDIIKENVRIAKANIPKSSKITYKFGDAQKIPFNKKFDLVFYTFSWHFIKNFKKALKEVKRVLSSKGILVIVEPSKNTTSWASPKLRKDSKEFDKKLYSKKLKALKIAKKEIEHQESFRIIEKHRNKKTGLNVYILK